MQSYQQHMDHSTAGKRPAKLAKECPRTRARGTKLGELQLKIKAAVGDMVLLANQQRTAEF